MGEEEVKEEESETTEVLKSPGSSFVKEESKAKIEGERAKDYEELVAEEEEQDVEEIERLKKALQLEPDESAEEMVEEKVTITVVITHNGW